jgi:hypothetical protein
VGGVVTGALLGAVMLAPSWRPLPAWASWVAPIAIMVIAFVGSISVGG